MEYFCGGSFASLDSPTGSALWLREGVHMHAGRPQKKVFLEKFCRISQVELAEIPTALNFNQNPDVCCWVFFLNHLCLFSAWGNSIFLSPNWGLFRSKVVLVWIQSHLVHGRWIWLRVGTMSVIDILLVFGLKVHGCYFTASFQEIDSKSMFFVLLRPYLQK